MRALPAFLILLAAGCNLRPTDPPPPAESEAGQWEQDLDYLSHNLLRLHPDPFTKVAPASFHSEVAALRSQIPDLERPDFIVGLLRITALLGDSHTRIDALDELDGRRVPLVLRFFEDGWFVTAAGWRQRRLIGSQLLAMDGRPVEEVVQTLGQIIPHESPGTLITGAERCLVLPEVLYRMGLGADPDQVRYLFASNRDGRSEVIVRGARNAHGIHWVSSHSVFQAGVPLYLRHTDSAYWWRFLPESNALYFQYNLCRDQEDLPFKVFARELLERLDEGDVERLVIDLRHNPGGKNNVIDPFLDGLQDRPEFTQPDRLFVLIGLKTFSAAMDASVKLRDRYHGTLVGATTSQRGHFFADTGTFHLPNTKLEVTYSTQRFKLLATNEPGLRPDVPVPISSHDYLAGHDPVMQWVAGRSR